VQKRLPNWFSKNEKNPPDTPPYSAHPQNHSTQPTDAMLEETSPVDNKAQDQAETSHKTSSLSAQSAQSAPNKDELAWHNKSLHQLGELYKTAKETVKETTHAYTSTTNQKSTDNNDTDNVTDNGTDHPVTQSTAANTSETTTVASEPTKNTDKTPPANTKRTSIEQDEYNNFAILEAIETQDTNKAQSTTKNVSKESNTIDEQHEASIKADSNPEESKTTNVEKPTNTLINEPVIQQNNESANHQAIDESIVAQDAESINTDEKETQEKTTVTKTLNNQAEHLNQARNSLKNILDDKNIPESIRKQLQKDFQQLQGMLHKLEKEQIHIAVFGRVSVGKSSLLNALIGKHHFSVSLLHGETKNIAMQRWEEYNDGNIYLLDTPGINEIDGEEREQMALNAAHRADLLLFVIDSDLTESEMAALRLVTETQRPSLLVINKADQYTEREQLQLRSIVRERIKGLITPENIVFTKAREQQETIIYVDQYGEERESLRVKPVDVSQLKSRLWDIMEAEGHTLAALNASLFASDMSGEVAQRILVTRQTVGRKLIYYYCVGKGVAVAANPIPVADLVAAAAIDAGMIAHLSKIYGLPITKHEAGELIQTISAQLIVLLGTTWAINIASSALKITTVGLSTLVTAATQGAIAWYSTLVIGRVAEAWLVNGKSWGDAGPKLVVQSILDDLDRDSVMKEAKQEIMLYLKKH
jgi:GTP-binding protein Era